MPGRAWSGLRGRAFQSLRGQIPPEGMQVRADWAYAGGLYHNAGIQASNPAPPMELPAGIPNGRLGLWMNFGPENIFVHRKIFTFPQFRGHICLKEDFYPQLRPQAVHKQQYLVHTLSTEVRNCGLCEWPTGR